MSAAEEEVGKLPERQPDRSSGDEIMRELAPHPTILRGIENSDEGATISSE